MSDRKRIYLVYRQRQHTVKLCISGPQHNKQKQKNTCAYGITQLIHFFVPTPPLIKEEKERIVTEKKEEEKRKKEEKIHWRNTSIDSNTMRKRHLFLQSHSLDVS